MNYLREEYPNPQWERKDWRCLNGIWDFEFDYSASAIDRRLYEHAELFSRKINIPFCPESKLSGIENKDFIPAVVYRKEIKLSRKDLEKRCILHFGAVDYYTEVYINGKRVGDHTGGYTPFEFDITEYVTEGNNDIFVYAKDDTRNSAQPSGKQSMEFSSHRCYYTRTTGIWQTVWLEFVPEEHIINAKYYTDPENGSITIVGKTRGMGEVKAEAFFDGKSVGSDKAYSNGVFSLKINLEDIRLWEVGAGNLYELVFTMGEDRVKSYFGLRNVNVDSSGFYINGKKVFQKLVLDQGFYPDGIYTAPTDEDMVRDIEISLGLGFIGARLHEKVFEPRFLYHCDRMGYVVWGEYPNWGFDCAAEDAVARYSREWSEAVNRDFNHPSVVCWCPFNETWGYVEKLHHNNCLSAIYRLTKELDSTRPCIDSSGVYHVVTDIYDVHDYTQDPEQLEKNYINAASCEIKDYEGRQQYKGKPLFVSEFGGMKWNIASKDGWGYGDGPKSEAEFIDRYEKLIGVLLDNPSIIGFCYTQLYDVEQEQNGLYTYDRKPKFAPEVLKRVMTDR